MWGSLRRAEPRGHVRAVGLCWGPAGGGAGAWKWREAREDSPGAGRRAVGETTTGAGRDQAAPGGRGAPVASARAQLAGLSERPGLGGGRREKGRHLGPRAGATPSRGPAPTRPVRAGLTWAVFTPQTGRPRRGGGRTRDPWPSERAGSAACECARRRGTQRGRRPRPRVLSQPVPAQPGAPPRPRGAPRLRSPARTGSPGTAVPPFPPAPRPLSTSGAGPPPVPAHLARPQFRAPGAAESLAAGEFPPRPRAARAQLRGRSGGVPGSAPPSRPNPAPARPIRRRAPGPALIRPGPPPGPPPHRGSRRAMPSAAAPRTLRASSRAVPGPPRSFLEIAPPRLRAPAARPPPRAHSPIVRVICAWFCLIMQDGRSSAGPGA